MLIINKWMSVIWCSCCWWIAVGEFVVQIYTCFMQILLKIYFIFICVIVKNLLITFCYKILIICWLRIYYKTVIANNNLLGKSKLIAKLYFISFNRFITITKFNFIHLRNKKIRAFIAVNVWRLADSQTNFLIDSSGFV